MTTPSHPERAPAIAVDPSRSIPQDVAPQALTTPRSPVEAVAPPLNPIVNRPDIESSGADAPEEATECYACHAYEAEIQRLSLALESAEQRRVSESMAWENREAECCPEDVGFPEYIATLRARVSQLEATVAGHSKLAAFGAWALKAFRDDDLGDVNGGDAQDAALRLGVLEAVSVAEPCGDACNCAEYGDFPLTCYRYPAEIAAALRAPERPEADAVDKGAQRRD